MLLLRWSELPRSRGRHSGHSQRKPSRSKTPRLILTLERFGELAGVEHGFGTRHDHIEQRGMASLRQIHSNRVLLAQGSGCAGEGDALITQAPGLALSIRTADCFPILLADLRVGAVAAIHAGWRGTVAGIAPETVRRMGAEFGTDPSDLFAAIGPGIGVCCYEVGDEVARRFGQPGKGKVDLAETNRAQLLECGVRAERIESIGRCTVCEPEIFYSYRRQGEKAGRMVSFIRCSHTPRARTA